MDFETSPLRLWRTLSREDRAAAARAFWNHPPTEAAAVAAREVVNLLRVRPQAFQKIPLEQRVRALAGLASPPESLAESLLVSLHVGERRALLVEFLDAAGIPHEEGLIAEDAELPELDVGRARGALAALRASGHPDAAIRVYWNALWLQDRARWTALEPLAAELG
jgi:hypothetical protein